MTVKVGQIYQTPYDLVVVVLVNKDGVEVLNQNGVVTKYHCLSDSFWEVNREFLVAEYPDAYQAIKSAEFYKA